MPQSGLSRQQRRVEEMSQNDNGVYWTSGANLLDWTVCRIGGLRVFGVHPTTQLLLRKRFVMAEKDHQTSAYLRVPENVARLGRYITTTGTDGVGERWV